MTISPHRKARRAALWLLYSIDVADGSADEALSASRATLSELDAGSEGYWEEIAERVRGVRGSIDRIDEVVQSVSPRWRLERMASIDRNILRLGAWEILDAKLPPIAVIDGCVELGKEFGDKGTSAFVNGLLDQICQDHDIEMR